MASGKKFGEYLLDFVQSGDDFWSGQLSIELLRTFLQAQGGSTSVKGPVDYIFFKDTEKRSLLRATRSLGAEDKSSPSAKWQPHWSDEEPRVRDGKVMPKDSRKWTSKRDSVRVAGDVLVGRIDKRLRRWPRIPLDTREKGLWNKDNMCYRNSILSCLLHQPTVYHYLKNVAHQCGRRRYKCTTCALKFLMKEYWSNQRLEKGVADPRAARRELDYALISDLEPGDAMEEDFVHERQSDAYDFAQHLITKLRDKEAPDSGAQIDDLFNLRTQESWTCQDCGKTSVVQAVSDTGLSLRIDDPKRGLTLQEYVKHSFDHKLSIRCESEACQKKHNYDSSGKKRSTGRTDTGFSRRVTKAITEVPELLFLKLDRAYSRYGANPKTGAPFDLLEQYKIERHVPFEERLDLTKYRSDGSEEKLLYRLDGVSAHRGQLKSGHYIAVVRRWHQQHAGTTFWTINDTKSPVKGSGFSSMQNPVVGLHKFDPCVLLYSRLHAGDPAYDGDRSSRAENQAARAVASDTQEQKTNEKNMRTEAIVDDPANFDLTEDITAAASERPRKRPRR
ncbi:cysteine proteinase [Teratosphaeria destructans]|uniref:ubiquitinyl hydrolase 1 n=1 Tax=Teratosphaeria destructans TaxID=418781 RepID=A0A9W7SYI4_9PEZI|nr:cysteine proteinase [Teratosphaeria destructans]